MRRVLIAMAVAGLLALGTVPVLAKTANGSLEAQGEAALNAIKQARETCFDQLEATVDATPLPESKEELAEAALKAALAEIRAVGGKEAVALKAALEAFDEDDDAGAKDAKALQKAIADAKSVPDAIKAACLTANANLKKALSTLTSTPNAVRNDDEDEDMEVERERDDHDKAKEAEHEKKARAEHANKGREKKDDDKDKHEDRD